ncbi:MAG: hypothetical protein LDL41_16355 [Coleofasciculus sp. S288]|nr:hypothetical protein [Coleofasciculus sp. S288]
MSETPGVYKIPAKPSWETQLNSLPPDVRSVAESLALRDMESARRYVSQYLSANRKGA